MDETWPEYFMRILRYVGGMVLIGIGVGLSVGSAAATAIALVNYVS